MKKGRRGKRVTESQKLEGTEEKTMAGEFLYKIMAKAGVITWPPESGKGKGKTLKNITYGFNIVKGKSGHAMEDYLVSEFRQMDANELGLFAIYDGHSGHHKDFWENTEGAIRSAYHSTDIEILEKSAELGKGGSTAVTAILINGEKLVIANIGDSRAVLCRNGVAQQLSVDHEPSREKKEIERRGGYVSTIPGDVPRVDGQLAVARAFGDKNLKIHLSSDPDIQTKLMDGHTEFLILASDGLWNVISNDEAVGLIRNIKNAQLAAKTLTDQAVLRKSTDDISCIVVRCGKNKRVQCLSI
ncbi:hypothetical protein V2J09_019199 [Rumex salicifolius]